MIKACYMCDNARINDDLEDYNDFSACSVGEFESGYRSMIKSGAGLPLSIEFSYWDSEIKMWRIVGIYNPKFCPNCGRKITEYKID